MRRVDKDGSGFIEEVEFICLMTEVMEKRDVHEEIKKIFRCFDHDDDGQINLYNL